MKMSIEQMKNTIIEEAKKLGVYEKIELSLQEAAENTRLNEEKYDEVYHRIDRLKKLTHCDAPSIILANELRTLCELYSSIHPNIEAQVKFSELHPETEV